MANRVKRFMVDLYKQFPNDDSDKILTFQASGRGVGDQYTGPGNPTDRHVLLYWSNGVNDEDDNVTQMIHLTGDPGNYAFYSPQAKAHSSSTFEANLHIQLGMYTRVQRDRILELAAQVQFYRRSFTNGCRVWMRDLLESLVTDGVLTEEMFTYLDEKVPLLRRAVEEE